MRGGVVLGAVVLASAGGCMTIEQPEAGGAAPIAPAWTLASEAEIAVNTPRWPERAAPPSGGRGVVTPLAGPVAMTRLPVVMGKWMTEFSVDLREDAAALLGVKSPDEKSEQSPWSLAFGQKVQESAGAEMKPTPAAKGEGLRLFSRLAEVARFDYQEQGGNRATVISEAAGAIVCSTPSAGPGPVAIEPSMRLRFASAQRQSERAGSAALSRSWMSVTQAQIPEAAGDALLVQRTWFALYEPVSTPKGIVLVLPGMLGTPAGTIQDLVRTLRSHGWAVLRMLAHPSRFTEQVRFRIDPSNGLADDAAGIAAVFDDRTAECAYAARAAFGRVLAERPGWDALPRVAVGMSGGAMVLPTVVALEPERYAAAVLIAGGANSFSISRRSSYARTIDAMRLDWVGGNPSPQMADALDKEYLRASTLDAYHTASALAGKPVLMLHGRGDAAVPADAGEVLWRRLGKPERWSTPMGHEWLFLTLSWKFEVLAAWIERAAAGQGN